MERERELFDVDFGPGLTTLASALSLDPAALTESALVDLVATFAGCASWLAAQQARVVAELAARRGGPTDEAAAVDRAVAARVATDEAVGGPGSRSGREPRPHFWEAGVLGGRLGLSTFDARRLVATAVDLCGSSADDGAAGPVARLPEVLTALEAGRVTWRQATEIAKATGRLSDAEAGEVGRVVLADGNVHTWQQTKRRAERAADAIQPVEPAGRAAREVSLREDVDGAVLLSGRLDGESGRVVATAVEAYATPTGPTDDRTVGERWTDALVEICRLALDSLAGQHPARRRALSPHLVLLADARATRHRGPTDTTALEPIGRVRLNGAGHLGPIDLTAAASERLCCDAVVDVAETARGVPAEVGERRRRLPGHKLRRLLALRDQGCRFPGCARPPSRCRPHHVVHWARGGATVASNLITLCDQHHRTVHDDGWTCTFDGRTAVFTDPFGETSESPPPLAPPMSYVPPPDTVEQLLRTWTPSIPTEPVAEAAAPQAVSAFAGVPPF